MKRHPFNVLSLIFGTFLVLAAVWATWIGFPTRGWFFDTSRWLLPAAAILVGGALLSPLFTRQGEDTAADETDGDPREEATVTPTDQP